MYSQWPQRILNVVFYSSSFFMRIRLYAPRRSNTINIFASTNQSLNSNKLGSGQRFLIVISLSFQQLTYSRNFSFFFRAKRIGYPIEDINSRINPFLRLTLIQSLNVLSSFSNRLQISLKVSYFPSYRTISQSQG